MNICVLGSTGSIGTKALQIAERYPEEIQVCSLVAGRNLQLLKEQVLAHRPKVVAVERSEDRKILEEALSGQVGSEIYSGKEGYEAAVSLPEVDVVISAIPGSAGLYPTYLALKEGKNLALANKESLVMAGPIMKELAKVKKLWIRPIDSEHSGIFQAMEGHSVEEINKVVITASGGPFRGMTQEELLQVSIEDALKHPNWKMGPKITVDSATLMNKGLEVMEAMWLFDLSLNRIQILIHPQSLVHALVEFIDGSVLAQLSVPDMTIPIAYALFYPRHRDILRRQLTSPLDMRLLNNLSFELPDPKLYPCLRLALKVAQEGRSFPVVLSAANDVAVEAFLQGNLRFVDIPDVISWVLDLHLPEEIVDIEQIRSIENWARGKTQEVIQKKGDKRWR